MSAYGEQIRSWLDPALQVLKDEHRADPERELRQRAAEMWDRLGATADDDPVAAALVTSFGELLDRVASTMTGEEQVSYFAGDTFERDLVELIEVAVARHAVPAEEQAESGAEAMTAAAAAEMVTGQVVRDLALPVLEELARTRPDLVARHSTDELLAHLGQVVVRRLLEQ